MGEAIAKVKYECVTDEGYKYEIIAEMVDGWGFRYGNHHGIVITEESGHHYGLDARYDNRFATREGFYENILDVLTDRYNIASAKLAEKG